MARPIVVFFPQADNAALLSDNVAGGGAVASLPLAMTYPIVFKGISRQITLTSTDNLSATNFTISGYDQYGNAISEVLAGPNNNTVTSVNYYNILSNIASNGTWTDFSVGWGSTGYIQWISLNYQIGPIYKAIQCVVTGTINYSLFQTLDMVGYYQPIEWWYKYTVGQTSPYLASNPLATTNTSATVIVTVPSTAGLYNDQLVTIAGATTTGGISAANLNITSPITVLTTTTFSYTAGAAATSTTTGGGSVVTYTVPPYPNKFPITADLTSATTNEFYSDSVPVIGLAGQINSSSAGGSLTLTILQSGLT